MKIVVKCGCGKILHVPMKYAGKRVRCPKCNEKLVVPGLSSPEEEKPSVSCPTCGSYVSSADEHCVTCLTNLKTGELSINSGENISSSLLDLKNSLQSWKYLLLLSHIVLLVYIVLLTNRAKPVIEERKEENSNYLISSTALEHFKNIEKMPEQNVREINEKAQALDTFLRKYASEIILKVIHGKEILKDKENFRLYMEGYEKLTHGSEEEPFQEWLAWQKLKEEYPQSIDSKWQKQVEKIEAKMLASFHLQISEIHQLLEEKRHQEVLSRVTPTILRFLILIRHPSLPEDFSKAWPELLNLYQNMEDFPRINSIVDPGSDHYQLELYRENFQKFLKRFYGLMYKREYDQAQKKLEEFWNLVNSLEKLNPDDELLVVIRDKLEDVRFVKRFFDQANEGAKLSVGAYKPLFPRNGKVILGQIANYILGVFVIQTEKGQQKRIPLKELRAEDLFFFALKAKKNKFVYQDAGVFFGYERDFSLAEKAFNEALIYGADKKKINRYLNWIEKCKKAFRTNSKKGE